MDPSQRRRILGLGTIGVAVFGLLTLTAISSRSLPGTTRSVALSWTVDVIEVIKVAVGVMILAAVVLSVISSRRNKEKDKAQKKAPPRRQSALAVLIVLAAIAALILQLPRRARDIPEEALPPEILSFSRFDFLPIEEVGSAWPLLVLLGLAGIVAGAIYLLSHREIDEDPDPDAAVVVADSLSDALAALAWSDEPRSVIIKAYYAIETALADIGMRRQTSEAPREYLQRVLGTAGLQPDSITRLTTLFELARFSEHELGTTEVGEARAALESALADLGAPAP